MKYTEETLQSWTKPASETEEQKIENTINMIKSAINASNEFDDLTVEIFVQGSYANNTNVRTNSDVDVCVMLTSTFYTEYPAGKSDIDYGFSKGTISYEEYHRRVKNAVVKKFGTENVRQGNKSLKVRSNTYHVNADVVVALLLKNYKAIGSTDPQKYIEGTRFFAANTGEKVTNYPKLHIENGKQKNNATNYNYKYLTRIFKRVRNSMVENGIVNGDKISSFLVECLVWNVPNKIFNDYKTWSERITEAIVFLHNSIANNQHTEWTEVSKRIYLFHNETPYF